MLSLSTSATQAQPAMTMSQRVSRRAFGARACREPPGYIWFLDTHNMKRIFAKFRDKISFKELPPPYRETENDVGQEQQGSYDQNNGPECQVLDLLANCTISTTPNDCEESIVEYAEIRDMGLWHSSPLTHRHKSKISLTWVLKENLERTKLPEKVQKDEWIKKPVRTEVDKLQRQNQKFNEHNQPKKCTPGEIKERVVGRNEYYHNLRFRTACEEFVNGQETYSDTSIGTEEYVRRKHRHRHRRKKTKQNSKFGYDIKDLDSFLTEATIDRPGNIPVVIAYPSTLYQTQKGKQRELTLPLGTVVNAVFKNEQWLYAQTPHGQEGYVLYGACLPLGILPDRPSSQKKTPCWESSTDIYPRPCGNLTDNEKEQLNGKTRSECRYKPKQQRKKQNSCAEKDFDTLYLKTKSVSNIDKLDSNFPLKPIKMKKQTLLVVSSDFKGSALNRTLSVQKGDVVTLVQGVVESDVDAEWFYVKKKDGKDGFIPASIAGHGYI